ncbi:MAG: hypothetical protein IT353_04255 [Gemmatimonadaceae bacterium]|nr:hypothetical protein [Gemmatimonadaceae bacterium]
MQRQWMKVAGLVIGGTVMGTACASSKSTTPSVRPEQPATVFVGGANVVQTVRTEAPRIVSRGIPRPPREVWLTVKQVYVDYQVPLTVDDAVAMTLGNQDFYRSQRFAGKRMPELVNCGSGMTGPNAASYRIYMSLLTNITDDGRGGSVLNTTLQASARDLVGPSASDRIPCASSGELERTLQTRVATLMGIAP